MPVLRWLRQRTDAELDLLLRLGGKSLIAAGLTVFVIWAWQRHYTRNLT